MKNPIKGFSLIVHWVDDTRDVTHLDLSAFLPLLDSKMLDIDVMRSGGRFWIIDHVEGCFVIFVDDSGF